MVNVLWIIQQVLRHPLAWLDFSSSIPCHHPGQAQGLARSLKGFDVKSNYNPRTGCD